MQDVCEEFEGSHDDVSQGAVTPLRDAHFTFGSCIPGSFDTYSFAVSAAEADSGLQVTVEDITVESNPNALGLYVYLGDIPEDMSTELKSEFSIDGTYSTVTSSYDLKEGLYHVVVRCTSASSASYRIVPKLTPAYVSSLGVQGYLCDGGWAYHYATAVPEVGQASAGGGGHGRRRQLSGGSASGGGAHARFHVLLHTGDAYYITKQSSVPLKLIPPYGHVGASEHHGIYAESCNVPEGERVYIGLKAGRVCADYEVYVEWFDGECNEMPFDEATLYSSDEAASGARELQPHHFGYDSCKPNEYNDYTVTISEEMASHTNLVIQLEDLSKKLDTNALGMYLYHGEISEDRSTEHFVDFTHDGIYELAVSKVDLQQGVYHIAVRCGPEPRAYRTMIHEIEAKLQPGIHMQGSVCPGDWVYHTYKHMTGGSQDAIFNLELHTGDVYYALRPDQPAITMTPPFHHTSAAEVAVAHHAASAPACDVHNGSKSSALHTR